MKQLKWVLFSVLIFVVSVANAQYTLNSNATAFYSEYFVTDTSGEVVLLPRDVQDALFAPQILTLIHGKNLIYCRTDTLFEYYIDKRSKREMLLAMPGTGCMCGLAWSPDSTHVLVLGINIENSTIGDYNNFLYLVDITGSTPPRKIIKPVNFFIPNGCQSIPGQDFYFVDNETIAYKVHLEMKEEGGTIKTVRIVEFR